MQEFRLIIKQRILPGKSVILSVVTELLYQQIITFIAVTPVGMRIGSLRIDDAVGDAPLHLFHLFLRNGSKLSDPKPLKICQAIERREIADVFIIPESQMVQPGEILQRGEVLDFVRLDFQILQFRAVPER